MHKLIFLVLLLLSISCTSIHYEHDVFKASYSNEEIIIDGKLNETSWNKTQTAQFNYHYNLVNKTDKQKTTFRMLWDENNIYLFYQCTDPYITARETQRDGATFFDDCAEIFLSPVTNKPKLHFCFEINLNKVSNDICYLNNFVSEQNAVIKAFNPDHKVAVSIDGTLNDNSDIDNGWTMEVAIPLTAFNRMNELNPIHKGTKWSFLALRQNRDEIEGNRRVTSIIYPNDKIENDVHQPEYFGVVEFVK